MSEEGIEAQFTVIKAWPARCEPLCMARAISSFPVPVSPAIRVGGSDFHDARKDRLQGGRGAHDLLKHEELIDLLSQREVLLPRSFLRLFAIVNVSACRIPADNLSWFVQKRVVLGQNPTILTIPAARASFVLEWDPSRDRRVAFVAQSLGILWMIDLAKAFQPQFFSRQAGVIQY